MSNNIIDLKMIETFGEVSAEDDEALLEYFLSTETVKKISDGDAFLVLGRKGSGKTSIVRHFTEGASKSSAIALNMRNYPWGVHAKRRDHGADEIDAYVASWRYLISVQVAAWALKNSYLKYHDEQKPLQQFLIENYGQPEPKISDIIRPSRLRISALSLMPQVLGNSIGGVNLDRGKNDNQLGLELDALSTSILAAASKIIKDCQLGPVSLHFDELDAGLTTLDDQRKNMINGLILAIRGIKRDLKGADTKVNPVLYLRTDIWDDLVFSDKNKITQSQSVIIEWENDSLKSLINQRLSAKISVAAEWEDFIDDQLMRGSQSKWNHIIARTLKRPRDVIQFLNIALRAAKKRDESPLQFNNKDIVNSRSDYSSYLKKELDDEIVPHWEKWNDSLKALSAISTETFMKSVFLEEYDKRKSAGNELSAEEALEMLHRFSVIGYEKRSGYGGSSWAFMYELPDDGWDAHANRFKVHPGLKEFAKLREERVTVDHAYEVDLDDILELNNHDDDE